MEDEVNKVYQAPFLSSTTPDLVMKKTALTPVNPRKM